MAGSSEGNHAAQQESVTNERTPLLVNASVAPTIDPDATAAIAEDNPDDDKPLPKVQVILLCYARFVEPLAFFAIFPFVNQMVQRNGNLPESEVGFYSGLIESLFSVTQMFVMIFWGRLSDRIGRKPVMVTSLIGVTITTGIFGFAKTIWQMILIRCLCGAFAGTVVTIRVMITEHSTPKTQARAFSFFMFASNLGILVGPLVGGVLADPAGQYGGGFKQVAFFVQFPYALSSLATGFICLTAVLVTAFFIEETLPSKQAADNELANGKPKDEVLSTWQLLKQPGVAIVLCLYSNVMLLAFAYTAIIPVFWFTSVPLGGFGLTPLLISLFMALTGASQALWILLAFPTLQRRYGTGWVLRMCSIAWPILFAFNPLLNLLLRHANANNVQWEKTLFWVIGPVLLCVGVGVSMSFAAIQLAVNNINPSPATLGTLNGLALSAASGVRAFTPVLFTSILALGVKNRILGGQLVWLAMIVLAGGLLLVVFNLPPKAEGRAEKNIVEEEQEAGGRQDQG